MIDVYLHFNGGHLTQDTDGNRRSFMFNFGFEQDKLSLTQERVNTLVSFKDNHPTVSTRHIFFCNYIDLYLFYVKHCKIFKFMFQLGLRNVRSLFSDGIKLETSKPEPLDPPLTCGYPNVKNEIPGQREPHIIGQDLIENSRHPWLLALWLRLQVGHNRVAIAICGAALIAGKNYYFTYCINHFSSFLLYQEKQDMYAINDPLGKIHSPASSHKYSHLKFVSFCAIWKSEECLGTHHVNKVKAERKDRR